MPTNMEQKSGKTNILMYSELLLALTVKKLILMQKDVFLFKYLIIIPILYVCFSLRILLLLFKGVLQLLSSAPPVFTLYLT